ncbi:2-oxo-4-hydroxy-4-carboxy-5-ureidoimidazoline decarboxylase [Marinomonas sp. 2405UD68-3]|uniref:2-oxo-4-hydroxy-4-carboxy-5-ureidoimidazoline decarboxylase n=1 Tax=Marinomonas sp. 2405UD68-3 TaxID=3391835 RepID=UPI0039C9B395
MTILKNKPSLLSYESFIEVFQGVYEHSPWVAEQAWTEIDLSDEKGFFDDGFNLALIMKKIVDKSHKDKKLSLLNAHPDLAGKAALAGGVTRDSSNEQAGAGLDACSKEELSHFHYLNTAYKEKNEFPFIMAVKGATKKIILESFEARINNSVDDEFAFAMEEVHKIALFRLLEK